MSIFFHKENRRRASAERFNSQRAAPGEKIENARADDCIAQTGKDRSFDAIHRRSNTVLRNGQADAAGAAGDYSHGDETGVAAGCGGASSEAAEGEGMGVSDSACFCFFFCRSVFPAPNKLLIILLRSRPTSRSIKFVLGRSMLPPT